LEEALLHSTIDPIGKAVPAMAKSIYYQLGRSTMENSIEEVLSRYICQDLLKQKDKVLTGQDALLSSGLIDSFHVVDLALFVEDTFGVILEDTELNKETFNTLSDLVQLIQQRQAGL